MKQSVYRLTIPMLTVAVAVGCQSSGLMPSTWSGPPEQGEPALPPVSFESSDGLADGDFDGPEVSASLSSEETF